MTPVYFFFYLGSDTRPENFPSIDQFKGKVEN